MARTDAICGVCGLIQLEAPTCRSCGARLNDPEVREPALLSAGEPQEVLHQLTFHGKGGALFGIQIMNALLSILTLGIYLFWGRVRVRKYLFGQTEIAGDRFAYHGNGKELFVGFLKAVPILAVIVLSNWLPNLLNLGRTVEIAGGLVGFGILYFLVIPMATVSALRYRLSRTSWRAVRFSFRGRVTDYIKLTLVNSLLSVVTLGFYYPFLATKNYAYLVSHAYFGSRKFEFNGKGREVLGSYVLAFLVTLPTFGLSWFWFRARLVRHLWSHTSLDALRFVSTVTGGRLLLLSLTNFLFLVVTLGLAYPWVRVRRIRFAFRHVMLVGTMDLATIQQEIQSARPTGEGLAGLLDLNLGIS